MFKDVGIRQFETKDLEQLDKIWNKFYKDEFSLPNLDNTLMNVVAEKDNKILAFGMIKHFAEGIAIFNHDASTFDRAIANDMILAKGLNIARNCGLDMFHVCVKDEMYIKLLQNKYGFEEPKHKILVKNL